MQETVQDDYIRKVRRRARSDVQNRNYICSCGKSYLSYPALYTHIKQKHDGKAPGSIQLPRNDKSKQKKFVEKDDEQEENSFKIIDQLQQFFKQNSSPPHENQCSMEWLFKPYPPEHHSHRVLTRLQEVLTNQVTPDKLSNQGTFPTKVNTIIAKFIGSVLYRWNPYFVKDVLFVLMSWRKTLNEGFSKFNSSLKPKLEYCEEQSGEEMLEVVNDLVLNVLQKQSQSCNLQRSSMFRSTKRQFLFSKSVLIISKWLFNQRLTNSKLRVNCEQTGYQ